ncbi:Transcription elongation factor S-II, central domain-containing protein [Artemisia annua]|uniref:Transcription elongation factor n=1 Tax=Artemisia annua TaxID=35608 RepID=A0A2U1QL87_ARTAN|nr:Transcription elongation factor S-II, central domain-containing protein [Artemisia annua]
MEKELIELFESVKKAADAAEEERCLDALNSLKKFPVNYQLLVSTQVGKRLRQLTKHPKKKIQSLASELVETWKGIIVEETIKNKKNGNLDIIESPKSNNTPVMSQNKFQRANSVKASREEEKKVIKTEIKAEKNGHNNTPTSEIQLNNVKVEKKPTINDAAPPKLTSLVYCKDPIRDKIRELLAEALCKVSGEADDESRDEVNACDPYRVAVSVESAMFEKLGKSNGAHKLKYRSVITNAKDPKNPDFRRKILLGHVKPERIVELTPGEMASTERQMRDAKIKEKALFECERGGPPKATTDQFRCGRCGQRKCTYYQLQTRSADEPMTTFVTCVNCDNHWKFC